MFRGCSHLTIYGAKGSAAEAYAKKYDIAFKEYGPEGDLILMSECTFTIEDQVYTGKKFKPDVKVKYAKQVLVKKASTVKKTLSGLKSRKTYYVRIRAYKTVDKATYCSAWSSAKKAKAK